MAGGQDEGTESGSNRDAGGAAGLFAVKAERAAAPALPWVLAGAVILVLVVGMVVAGHRKPQARGVLPLDAQAGMLAFSGLTLSESTSLSGGKSTYVDGIVRNNGAATVKAVTVQALFANDQAMPPQVETLPLALIRTREPYVDTQQVGAAPLAPGTEREFRLIFEDISPNWNQQPPALRVVHVSTQ